MMKTFDDLDSLVGAASRGGAGAGIRLRAQAMVELALLLPFILFLAVGTIELGRAFLALGTVEAGSYRGSTYAAFSLANAIDQAAIREAVVADWGPLPLSSSNPTVTVNLTREPVPPAPSSAQAYDAVQIQVSYNLPPLMSWPGIPSIPLLRSSTTMRIQP